MKSSQLFPPVPSAPPTSVSISSASSSSITVQWGAVDCIHQNGDITGYIVLYAIHINGSAESKNVSGGDATEAMLTGLVGNATYYIEVAAVNSAGIGEYSNPITGMAASKGNLTLLTLSPLCDNGLCPLTPVLSYIGSKVNCTACLLETRISESDYDQ